MSYLLKKALNAFVISSIFCFLMLWLLDVLVADNLDNLTFKMLLSLSFSLLTAVYFSVITMVVLKKSGVDFKSFIFRKQLLVRSGMTIEELAVKINTHFRKRIENIKLAGDTIVINTRLSFTSLGECIKITQKEDGFVIESSRHWGFNLFDNGINVANQYRIKNMIAG